MAYKDIITNPYVIGGGVIALILLMSKQSVRVTPDTSAVLNSIGLANQSNLAIGTASVGAYTDAVKASYNLASQINEASTARDIALIQSNNNTRASVDVLAKMLAINPYEAVSSSVMSGVNALTDMTARINADTVKAGVDRLAITSKAGIDRLAIASSERVGMAGLVSTERLRSAEIGSNERIESLKAQISRANNITDNSTDIRKQLASLRVDDRNNQGALKNQLTIAMRSLATDLANTKLSTTTQYRLGMSEIAADKVKAGMDFRRGSMSDWYNYDVQKYQIKRATSTFDTISTVLTGLAGQLIPAMGINPLSVLQTNNNTGNKTDIGDLFNGFKKVMGI